MERWITLCMCVANILNIIARGYARLGHKNDTKIRTRKKVTLLFLMYRSIFLMKSHLAKLYQCFSYSSFRLKHVIKKIWLPIDNELLPAFLWSPPAYLFYHLRYETELRRVGELFDGFQVFVGLTGLSVDVSGRSESFLMVFKFSSAFPASLSMSLAADNSFAKYNSFFIMAFISIFVEIKTDRDFIIEHYLHL